MKLEISFKIERWREALEFKGFITRTNTKYMKCKIKKIVTRNMYIVRIDGYKIYWSVHLLVRINDSSKW